MVVVGLIPSPTSQMKRRPSSQVECGGRLFQFPLEQAVPVITLPDGSQRSFDRAVTVAEVAASIGAGLARAALAGRVDGRLVDASFRIESDAKLSIVTDRDADGLEIIRRSSAHCWRRR
jgi:hypothetical protein